MKKISVIIPVYNTESYLRQCLDSVISQTYTNLEIVCVDDGSPDKCGTILDEYAARDNRIKIVHQENRGISSAMNAGLTEASGDYYGFIDSDDWIEPRYYEKAVMLLESIPCADIACFSHFKDYPDGRTIREDNLQPVNKGLLSQEDTLLYTFKRDTYRGFTAYLPTKLFDKRFFTDLNLRFDETLAILADVLMFVRCALNSSGLVYSTKAYYHYRQRDDSITKQKDFQKQSSYIKGYEETLNVLREADVCQEIINYAERFTAYHAGRLFDLAVGSGDIQWAEYFRKAARKYKDSYILTNLEYTDRISWFERILAEG